MQNGIYLSNYSLTTLRYGMNHPMPRRLFFNFGTQCKNFFFLI
jgi:hypothetical protein